MLITQLEGSDLLDLWFRTLTSLVQDYNNSQWNHPSIFSRWVFGTSTSLTFDVDSQMFKDFLDFSGYSIVGKMRQLRAEYFYIKQEKQLQLIQQNFRALLPRQTRAFIQFSEPAFDSSTKMKCLDSLYLQKTTPTEFDVFLIFRSTEVFPKTPMDFYLMYHIISELARTTKTKCNSFQFLAINTFINLTQAPLVALLLKKYGIGRWNPEFKKCIESFFRKYPEEKAEEIKLQSLKRVISRVYKKLREYRVDPVELL